MNDAILIAFAVAAAFVTGLFLYLFWIVLSVLTNRGGRGE